jgi:hypothetical protein
MLTFMLETTTTTNGRRHLLHRLLKVITRVPLTVAFSYMEQVMRCDVMVGHLGEGFCLDFEFPVIRYPSYISYDTSAISQTLSMVSQHVHASVFCCTILLTVPTRSSLSTLQSSRSIFHKSTLLVSAPSLLPIYPIPLDLHTYHKTAILWGAAHWTGNIYTASGRAVVQI